MVPHSPATGSCRGGSSPRAAKTPRRSPGAAAVLAIGLLALLAGTFAGAVEPVQPEAAKDAAIPECSFCKAPLYVADFCPVCGRFTPLASSPSGRRFWGDAPYVLAFPPQQNVPEIQSEITAQGLVRESVRYASGDRYEMKMDKRGPVITGRVGWMSSGKETEFSADVEETFDASRRLSSREVKGRLKADPDMYLYRRLEYRYRPDGKLDRIEFATSFYRGSSDWKKSPASWVRHNAGEILLERDERGLLTRIQTRLREGRRSLRGEPEYAAPQLLTDVVTREGDQIVDLSRSQP